jgi:signal transduction histidine kinase
VTLTIENPVRGEIGDASPHPTSGGGYGIIGMSERAHAAGGDLTAVRRTPDSPGKGAQWRVRASIPISGEAGMNDSTGANSAVTEGQTMPEVAA